MSRLVFHTLHIVVDNFADSLEEELGTIAKEDQLWYDIKLVRDINPYRQGLGLYAVFYDEDKQNNLQDRMKKLAEKILSSRNRIMEIGYWPETTISDVRHKGPADSAFKKSEIKFSRAASVAA